MARMWRSFNAHTFHDDACTFLLVSNALSARSYLATKRNEALSSSCDAASKTGYPTARLSKASRPMREKAPSRLAAKQTGLR